MKGADYVDDRKIIDLFFARSEQAVTALSDTYGTLLLQIATDILGGQADAEECVNDVYFCLWSNIPPLRPESLRAYAVRILRNLAVKCYYANMAQKRNSQYDLALEELAEILPGGSSPEEEVTAREPSGLTNRFPKGLDRESRICFVRRYYLAERPAYIGKQMGHLGRLLCVGLYLRHCFGRYSGECSYG